MSWDTLPKDNLEYLLSKLKTDVLDNKVDTEAGKGLSSNDFTTAEKTKLAGISSEATKVEASETNGNIVIDNVETQVYDDTEVKDAIEDIDDIITTDENTVEGNPINFSTLSAQKSKSTILSVEPIQDLHGYDKPWVGGAGKNKLPMTVANLKSANTSGTWNNNVYSLNNVTFTILTDNDNNVIGINVNTSEASFNTSFMILDGVSSLNANTSYTLNGCPSGGSASTYSIVASYIGTDTGGGKTGTPTSDQLIDCQIKISNGASISNKVFYPMIRLSTESDATFAPYTNYASTSGRTEVNLDGCGKNLLPMTVDGIKSANPNRTWTGNSTVIDDITFTILTDSDNNVTGIKANGIASGNAQLFIKKAIGLTSGDYIINGAISSNKRMFFYDGTSWYDDHGSGKNFTISSQTTQEVAIFITNGQTTSNEIFYPMIRLATETDPTFEPYTKSNDLTLSFGQTVYGGQLDVEKGELVVDRKYKLYDGSSDEEWAYSSAWSKTNTNVFFSDVAIEDAYFPFYDVVSITNCNCFEGVSRNRLYEIDTNGVSLSGSTSQGKITVRILKSTASSLVDFETWIASNNIEIVYILKTPITIQLTPNEISLLEGVNNISTTGDKITLTYRNGKFATLDGAVPKMTFRGEDYTMGVDDIGLFLKNLTKSTKTYIESPLLNFDGTVATYKKIMKQWFINNGVNVMDSNGLTYLCERWYELTKQGWKGGTSFPAVGVSTVSTGTRFDDNVDMSVTPSTDTSANTDTYQGLPLFAITDCNWELDSDGNILITAIDGITDNFVRNDPTKFVGVMQQTGWVKKVDDETTQKYYYADDKNAYPDLVPLPEAIKLDGTVRSFVVHAKYMSGIVDSKMTCCSGVVPRKNISHDSLVTLPDNIGTQYSGGTSVDWSFLVWMQRIKYASLTSDGILQGCCNYNYQYYVKVGEADVKRLILASNQGGNLKVGSTITFGAYAGNADRGNSDTYSISGQDGAIITSIEDVTIDGTTYKAVYVNTTNTFTTVANGDATNGTTIVSTYHWISGSCDNVKGNDGSPVSATNGQYPAKLQGIEYMVGGYEVFADVIMNISDGYYNPYYARKSTEQATSITSSMVQSTLKCAQPASDAWRYIQKHGFDGEIFYPILTGTSSSEYMKDAFYENGTGTTTGTREWLAFGNLTYGSGNAGLSCLHGNNGLGNGWWTFVARLSCNGNRGILLTA